HTAAECQPEQVRVAGEWAILVEGISDDCRVLASHCERVQLPTDAPLEVTLALVQPEPACGRELICDGAGRSHARPRRGLPRGGRGQNDAFQVAKVRDEVAVPEP